MNRLVIIGNGFDLAHGLETRYEDFMFDLIHQSLKNKLKDRTDENGIIKIVENRSFKHRDLISHVENLKTISNILESRFIEINEENTNKEIIINISEFIFGLFKMENWTDIENYYYKNLLNLFKQYNRNVAIEDYKSEVIKKVNVLNKEFELLKGKLVEYLQNLDKAVKISAKENNEFRKIIEKNLMSNEEFKLEFLNKSNLLTESSLIKYTYFLNFNYTNTLSKHFEEIGINKDRFKEIKIHGSIDKPETIIFGYGDEKHKSYQEIEDLNKNEFFTHIKSFGYFQDDEYQKLIAFVKSGEEFEVYVLGHSLGLSDRTMLSTIFNAEKLSKIHLFYYEYEEDKKMKDDYTQKTFEISRHFKDKENMREKIVPKKESQKMPNLKPESIPTIE